MPDVRHVAVIGNGRVGGSVAAAAHAAGLHVSIAGHGADLSSVVSTADLVLICVPDKAVAAVCAELAESGSLPAYVGHMSGASGLDALEPARSRGADTFSLHPLQTIPKPETDLSGAPAAVSGSTPTAVAVATALAERLGMRPFDVPDDRRAAYHTAAVFASNFLVALEETAVELLGRASVTDARSILGPLVRQSAANWSESGADALTGPIARGDESTIARHREALRELAPDLLPLYDELATRTRKVAARAGSTGARPERRHPVSTPVVVRTRDELRTLLAPARREARSIGLVPTMGFLHEGHLSLVRAARTRTDVVVMSLFVNPTQFGAGEDLAAYPRDEERDVRLAGEAGADIIYAPDARHVYPDGFATTVEVTGGLTDVLCGDPGRRGPGHFRGVTTVVAKLLNAVGPDVVFFGQKDAQQTVVVRRMVRDLEFPAEVVVLPTVREPDGLAMSSRNVYLDASARTRALSLRRALVGVSEAVRAGETSTGDALASAAKVLAEAGVEPEYLEARHADDLTVAPEFGGRPVLVAVAARVGRARLIDNIVIDPSGSSPQPTGGSR
ncbi:MAG TPA: pantoate--beta-alanine ligase [Actinopolymorphaceae bacterium]|nr:pantoate--beta-alanine ligase [Actinopolymorphaceae bacterium]